MDDLHEGDPKSARKFYQRENGQAKPPAAGRYGDDSSAKAKEAWSRGMTWGELLDVVFALQVRVNKLEGRERDIKLKKKERS